MVGVNNRPQDEYGQETTGRAADRRSSDFFIVDGFGQRVLPQSRRNRSGHGSRQQVRFAIVRSLPMTARMAADSMSAVSTRCCSTCIWLRPPHCAAGDGASRIFKALFQHTSTLPRRKVAVIDTNSTMTASPAARHHMTAGVARQTDGRRSLITEDTASARDFAPDYSSADEDCTVIYQRLLQTPAGSPRRRRAKQHACRRLAGLRQARLKAFWERWQLTGHAAGGPLDMNVCWSPSLWRLTIPTRRAVNQVNCRFRDDSHDSPCASGSAALKPARQWVSQLGA